MLRHVCGSLLLLTGIATASAQTSLPLCRMMADQLAAQPVIPPGGVQDLAAALGALPGGIYRPVPETRWNDPDPIQLAAILQHDHDIAPDLVHDIEAMENVDVVSVPGTTVRILVESGGTAHCISMMGIAVPATGTIARVPHPMNVQGPGSCGLSVGGATISGLPALVVLADGGSSSADLTVSPWRADRFEPPCSMTVHYAVGFTADHAFCHDVDCGPFMRQAELLAQRSNTGENAKQLGVGLSPAGGDPQFETKLSAYARAAENAAEQQVVTLPTFGARFDSPYITMADPVAFPVLVEGGLFLARLGRGQFGWRDSPDILVAFYRLDGNTLEPIVGVVVTAERRYVLSVEVK